MTPTTSPNSMMSLLMSLGGTLSPLRPRLHPSDRRVAALAWAVAEG